MENIPNMEGNEIGMVIVPLLWVVMLMAIVVVSYVGKRMNENNRQRIGVELELIKDYHFRSAPNERIVTWLRKLGIEATEASYGSSTNEEESKVVHDGSLNTGGFEIVSPPLYDGNHKEWAIGVADAMAGVGKPDSSCGMHTHNALKKADEEWGVNGVMDYETAKGIAGAVAYAYGHFQEAWDSIVSASRRGHQQYLSSMTYMVEHGDKANTKQVQKRVWDDDNEEYILVKNTKKKDILAFHYSMAKSGNGYGRYVSLNVDSMRKHGTIEFRQHQGTANASKIIAWADLTSLFVQRCSDYPTWQTCVAYGNDLDGLMQFIGLSSADELRHYWTKRKAILSGEINNLQRARSLVTIKACPECNVLSCEGMCVSQPSTDLVERKAHFEAYTDSIAACLECGEAEYVNNICDAGERFYSHDWDEYIIEGFCDNCDATSSFAAFGGLIMSLLMGISPLFLAITVLIACGIGAIHRGSQGKANGKRLKNLWRGLQARGAQAAGMGWVNNNDPEHMWYLKEAQPAKSLVHHLKRYLNKHNIFTMLHTRFATHGVNNAANAHPHFGPEAKVMMVHNGVVTNQDEVYEGLKIKSLGPVDSQAVAACLEIGGIEKVVEHCEGSMSLIWTDRRDPLGTLKCWTNGGNPLVMGRLDDKQDGAVVIASTAAIMLQSMGKRLKTDWDAVIGREYTIHPDGKITKRDIEGSEDTYTNQYISWRNYATWHNPSKATKTYKKQGNKYLDFETSDGEKWSDRDMCEFESGESSATLSDAIMRAYENMDEDTSYGQWQSYHGYCASTHEGITPQGDYYRLHVSINGVEDMASLLMGEFHDDAGQWPYTDHDDMIDLL
jgi:uncharacterized membrane protein